MALEGIIIWRMHFGWEQGGQQVVHVEGKAPWSSSQEVPEDAHSFHAFWAWSLSSFFLSCEFSPLFQASSESKPDFLLSACPLAGACLLFGSGFL